MTEEVTSFVRPATRHGGPAKAEMTLSIRGSIPATSITLRLLNEASAGTGLARREAIRQIAAIWTFQLLAMTAPRRGFMELRRPAALAAHYGGASSTALRENQLLRPFRHLSRMCGTVG